ncbi:hypothetical protein NDU88_007051 [Pleurodeles waltl]|uniref:Peptidase A2 domain-containing protein n=1 Tax=Pleurodeles waltl TaxID=8319 RepID=A0AAV7RQP8_PLEWA|nr:hypothetical protein NDU88_007051 [Pleurodeles waltl]
MRAYVPRKTASSGGGVAGCFLFPKWLVQTSRPRRERWVSPPLTDMLMMLVQPRVSEQRTAVWIRAREPERTTINGVGITALIDTGASVNVIDDKQFSRLQPRPEQLPMRVKNCTYGGTEPLPLKGVIKEEVRRGDMKTTTRFHVTKGNTRTLLGCLVAEDLGLIFFAKQVHQSHAEEVLDEFPEFFQGLECLKGV